MGDGRKWAAEQEETAADERATQLLQERVDRFKGKVAADDGYVRSLLAILDSARDSLVQLRLDDKPLRYEDHVQARKLKSHLENLDIITR